MQVLSDKKIETFKANMYCRELGLWCTGANILDAALHW